MAKRILQIILILLLFFHAVPAQDHFSYYPEVSPVFVPGLPGIHSYAIAEHKGKWLIIGGRLDGIHARQPFNAFPVNQNNTEIFVVDIKAKKFWTRALTELPVAMQEQLQSANMNFYQDGDTLVIAGGYGYSKTAAEHITFPNLTTVLVKPVINAVINNKTVAPFFKQINDSVFAVTGGQLSKLKDEYYLVGGHRFMGRYNPMLGPTFVQTYTNEIRKFRLNNKGKNLSYTNYSSLRDEDHLHRRDYNLIPQIFNDGSEGFLLSSGVFQYNFDLPYLYPVLINEKGYYPQTSFYQFLSNYHSPNVSFYNRKNNEMNTLFFGGMSQYYFQDSLLIQDNDVPFVNTISLLTTGKDGVMQEYEMKEKMPGLMGASCEFIQEASVPLLFNNIIDINRLKGDTILIGYIMGGIKSASINPFANNSPEETVADTCVYRVRLIRSKTALSLKKVDGTNPYKIDAKYDNDKKEIQVAFRLFSPGTEVSYIVTDNEFNLVSEKDIPGLTPGEHLERIPAENVIPGQFCNVTFTFNNMYYESKRIMIE